MNKNSIIVGLTLSVLAIILVFANDGLLHLAYSTSLGDSIREEVNEKVGSSSRDGDRDEVRDSDEEAKEEGDEARDRDNDDDRDDDSDDGVGVGGSEGSGMQIFVLPSEIRDIIERADSDDGVGEEIRDHTDTIISGVGASRDLICFGLTQVPCDPE